MRVKRTIARWAALSAAAASLFLASTPAHSIAILCQLNGQSSTCPITPDLFTSGRFTFTSPTSGFWFDPIATGFEIEMVGGFVTRIQAPGGFNDMTINVGGTNVDTDFDAGDLYTFAAGVSKFHITGFSVDLTPTAFPLYMEFDNNVTSMTWTADIPAAVPEPSTYALMLLGLAGMGVVARRKVGQTKA